MAFDYKKEYKEFYLPKNKPEIIEMFAGKNENGLRQIFIILKELPVILSITIKDQFPSRGCLNNHIMVGY